MKRFFFLPVFFILIFSCSRNQELIVLTDHGFPPFEYLENGEPAGVDPDIAVEIGRRLGKKVLIRSINFSSIIPSIEKGFGDIGLAAITVTEERKKHVDFSIPYAKSEQFLVSSKYFPIMDKNELEGLKIGVKQGTTGHIVAGEMSVKRLEILLYSSVPQVIDALLNGSVDAVIIDQLPAMVAMSEHPSLYVQPLDGTAEYYALCVRKGKKKFLSEINVVLEDLIASGKIDALLLKHFTVH